MTYVPIFRKVFAANKRKKIAAERITNVLQRELAYRDLMEQYKLNGEQLGRCSLPPPPLSLFLSLSLSLPHRSPTRTGPCTLHAAPAPVVLDAESRGTSLALAPPPRCARVGRRVPSPHRRQVDQAQDGLLPGGAKLQLAGGAAH